MMQFFEDMSVNVFLLNGLLAGIMAAVCSGLIGPYVITKRIVFLAGAIAHMALAGVGLFKYLDVEHGLLTWVDPSYGAMLAAVVGAVIVALVHHYAQERLDTLIGALWSVGMAVGLLFIKMTSGYHEDLMTYLFGNLSTVSTSQLWMMVGILAVLFVFIGLFHKQFAALCIDEEQAALQGVKVLWVNMLLLVLVAITVICLMQVVGLILVIALLSLPAAVASHYMVRLTGMMIATMILSAVLTIVPRIAVYGSSFNAGAVIVIACGVLYLLSFAFSRLWFSRRTLQ